MIRQVRAYLSILLNSSYSCLPCEFTLSTLLCADDALGTLLIVLLSPGILKDSEVDVGGRLPCLMQDAEAITLVVEGVEVLVVGPSDGQWQAEMMLAWGMTFYIFNLKGGTEGNNVNWFLREEVFHLQQENSVTERVLQAITEHKMHI